MILWVAAASIAAIVAAAAAVVSAAYYRKTLKIMNEQTELSRRQFDMALHSREEMARPHLTVRVKFVPPRNPEAISGTLTVTVQNLGAIELRNFTIVLIAENGPARRFGSGTRNIPPGASDEVRDFFHIAPQGIWVTTQTKCEFEIPTGKKFAQWDKWKVYYSPESESEHLESRLEEL